MFIAFEGPDNVGKSTSAANLATSGHAIYNATKGVHQVEQQRINPEPDLLVTYDRIDWFSHMVYRLALPTHEWNDARVRTVFAMPDTHLVVKLHRPDMAEKISDELYKTGTLAEVNPVYYYFTDWLMQLNRIREYNLFKTISIVEVVNDQQGNFSQRLAAFDSPIAERWDEADGWTDEALLELLRHEDQHR